MPNIYCKICMKMYNRLKFNIHLHKYKNFIAMKTFTPPPKF